MLLGENHFAVAVKHPVKPVSLSPVKPPVFFESMELIPDTVQIIYKDIGLTAGKFP